MVRVAGMGPERPQKYPETPIAPTRPRAGSDVHAQGRGWWAWQRVFRPKMCVSGVGVSGHFGGVSGPIPATRTILDHSPIFFEKVNFRPKK